MTTSLAIRWDKGKQQTLGKTAGHIQLLQTQVPLTDPTKYGTALPTAYVNPDVVLLNPAEPTELSELVEQDPDTITPLTYINGYAETPDGNPFWERLENEPPEYYQLFKAYRNDTYLDHLNKGPQTKLRKARSLYKVADYADISRRTIQILANMWHWHERAKCYDAYNREQLNLEREAKQTFMEQTHHEAARKIFTKTLQYIEKHQDEMDPKTALQWFQTAVELERLSLGMPKDRPPDTDDPDAQRTDRRPWVQIQMNQQTNADPNKNKNEVNVLEDRNTRIKEILSTLNESGALGDDIND